MSYGSVSPALSDKSRYPKFFRTSSSDVGMNPVRIAMMKQFNWKRVATISESLEIFTKVNFTEWFLVLELHKLTHVLCCTMSQINEPFPETKDNNNFGLL